MSLVDLGKKLLEAARAGQDDEVRILMANGAPFTTDWVMRILWPYVSTRHFFISVSNNHFELIDNASIIRISGNYVTINSLGPSLDDY